MSSSFRRHVAVFGGSFNPPHLGHIAAVRGLLKNPGVSRVLVVPSFGTPLKNVTTPFEQRFEMARVAFETGSDAGTIEVSTLEKDLGIRYTWELLTALDSRLAGQGTPCAFVIGTDQFTQLRSWNRFPEVLKLSDWLVLLRKPVTGIHEEALKHFVAESLLVATPDPKEWRIAGSQRLLRFVETDAPEVSSTRIREQLTLRSRSPVGAESNPESIAEVPATVMEWIQRNHLYGT